MILISFGLAALCLTAFAFYAITRVLECLKTLEESSDERYRYSVIKWGATALTTSAVALLMAVAPYLPKIIH